MPIYILLEKYLKCIEKKKERERERERAYFTEIAFSSAFLKVNVAILSVIILKLFDVLSSSKTMNILRIQIISYKTNFLKTDVSIMGFFHCFISPCSNY